jgi:hypothetical protein
MLPTTEGSASSTFAQLIGDAEHQYGFLLFHVPWIVMLSPLTLFGNRNVHAIIVASNRVTINIDFFIFLSLSGLISFRMTAI